MANLFYKYSLRSVDSPDNSLLFHTVEEQKSMNFKWYERFHQINISFSPHPKTMLDSLTFPSSILHSGLRSMFIAIWKGALTQTKKLQLLNSMKQEWGAEPYINSLPHDLRVNITRLRLSAHRLPIELGRYQRPIIPRDERYCKICSTAGYPNMIGDEPHLLFRCIISLERRRKLLGKLREAIDTQNLSSLFNLKGSDLVNLGRYVNYIYSDYLKASQE